MRVAVLGPLEVTANNSAPVGVPGAQERLLLAVLAAHAPDAVPMDRLVAALVEDEDDGPDGDAVQAAVHRLRGALEPGLPDRSSGQYVLRRGPGYALAVPRGDVDASRFTDLAARGAARIRADPAEAQWLLTTALGLWRGEPYEEWPGAPFAQVERQRLEAVRRRVEADLRDAQALAGRREVQPAGPMVGRRTTAAVPVRIVPVRTVPVRTVPVRTVPLRTIHVPPPGPPPGDAPARPRLPQPEVRDLAGGAVSPARSSVARPLVLIAGLVVLIAAALSTARLSGRADQQTQQAVTVADANRLAAMSQAQGQLDVALVLAVQAYRLADTSVTRDALAAVLGGHERVQRTVSFYGTPEEAVLSGGSTLTFGLGVSVAGWPVGPQTVPRLLLPLPGNWGALLVAAPSPVEDVVLVAGIGRYGPWIRRVSTSDGTSDVLLEGAAVGGRPVAGAVSPDGRRLQLVVAQQHDQPSGYSSTWQLIDVDAATGARLDTGIDGVLSSPADRIRADFAEDAASVVVWNATAAPAPSGTLVQLSDGRQVTLPAAPDRSGIRGFQAYRGGALELWDDGGVSVLDRDGQTLQELGAPQRPVLDVAVAPNGRWAVTGGSAGEVFRWDVDPATGRWSRQEALRGHSADVVSVEVDAPGRLLATVAADHTAITWDMSPDGARPARDTPAPWEQLLQACRIVGRDLTPPEWQRALPDRPWQPTCSDLL